MIALVPNSAGSDLLEFNPCHRPKGEGGGQFAGRTEGECAPGSVISTRQPGVKGIKLTKVQAARVARNQLKDADVDEILGPKGLAIVDSLLEKGTKAHPHLVKLFERLQAAGMNAVPDVTAPPHPQATVQKGPTAFYDPRVKSVGRTRYKSLTENGGDIGRTRDVVRGSIYVDTVAEAYAVLRALRSEVDVVQVKDKIQAPMSSGYRDLNTTVRLPGNFMAEVLIIPREIANVKEGGGHKLYEEQRTLVPFSPRWNELEKQMQDLYNPAWERVRKS